MLDIIIIIAAILSFYVGYRRGFIAQLINLVGLYLAILLAPVLAEPVGSIFFDNEYLAYVAGFFVVLAVAMLLMWFISPIVSKLLFWNPFKGLDAILGGVLNLVVTIIVASSLFAAFDYANINTSKPNAEKIGEHIYSCASEKETAADLKSDALALANGDIKTLRTYFRPRFVEYKTLESSALFDPLAGLGRAITPSLGSFKNKVRDEAKENIDAKYGICN
jgi:uncharacterized membrane protein required for colicin V production